MGLFVDVPEEVRACPAAVAAASRWNYRGNGTANWRYALHDCGASGGGSNCQV